MSTIHKIAAGGLAGVLITLIPTTASAATYEVGNSSLSVYSINVYTDSSCSQNRRALRPGWYQAEPSTRSTRVNAYSRVKRPGGSYGPLIAPNVCVRVNDPGRTWVRNYSNA